MFKQRGVINNRARAQQIINYSGLRYDTITPTDIDGFIDFGNKVFVIMEFKHSDAPLPYGQRLALKRLCDSIKRPIEAWLLICRHNGTCRERATR